MINAEMVSAAARASERASAARCGAVRAARGGGNEACNYPPNYVFNICAPHTAAPHLLRPPPRPTCVPGADSLSLTNIYANNSILFSK